MLFTVPSRYCALSVAACSSPWTVVSPASAQVLRARTYSGAASPTVQVVYGTFTLFGAAFQTASTDPLGRGVVRQYHPGCPTTPGTQRLAPCHAPGLGAYPVRSPLLRVSFSLPPATEMFQLAGCPPGLARSPPQGRSCLIRRSLDQCLLATPQSFSERCPVLPRHAAPGHPSCAHSVFPAHWHSAASSKKYIVYHQRYIVSKVHHLG